MQCNRIQYTIIWSYPCGGYGTPPSPDPFEPICDATCLTVSRKAVLSVAVVASLCSREGSGVVMSFVRYRGCLSEMTKVTYFWLPADIKGLALNWLFFVICFSNLTFTFLLHELFFSNLTSTVWLYRVRICWGDQIKSDSVEGSTHGMKIKSVLSQFL